MIVLLSTARSVSRSLEPLF